MSWLSEKYDEREKSKRGNFVRFGFELCRQRSAASPSGRRPRSRRSRVRVLGPPSLPGLYMGPGARWQATTAVHIVSCGFLSCGLQCDTAWLVQYAQVMPAIRSASVMCSARHVPTSAGLCRMPPLCHRGWSPMPQQPCSGASAAAAMQRCHALVIV